MYKNVFGSHWPESGTPTTEAERADSCNICWGLKGEESRRRNQPLMEHRLSLVCLGEGAEC